MNRCDSRFGISVLLLALAAPCAAATLQNLTRARVETHSVTRSALDDAGSVLYAVATTSQFGGPSRHPRQIVRWYLPSGLGELVTDFDGDVDSVSVSDDGQWLVYVSTADLTGSNHDESPEVFVMQSDGTGIAQLTSDPGPEAFSVYRAEISGSGNRVVLIADTNPLGTNGTHKRQVFVVDRSGANLRQLTSGDDQGVITASISDDGGRVVYMQGSASRAYGINADGTGLHAISPSSVGVASNPSISGDGTKVIYDHSAVYVVNWDGTGNTAIVLGSGNGTLTDDGQYVVFLNNSGSISRIRTDGTGQTVLFPFAGWDGGAPVISGNGGRIAFPWAGQVAGGTNPDHGYELIATDGTGALPVQLTVLAPQSQASDWWVPLVADGSTYYYTQANQIYRADSSGLTPVTSLAEGASDPSSPDDGSFVVFTSTTNQTGNNPNHSFQLFRVDRDGTGLLQLTPSANNSFNPASVSSDGQWVAFVSRLAIGSNTDGTNEVFQVRTDGSGLAPLTSDNNVNNPNYTLSYARLSAGDGSGAFPSSFVYHSSTNSDHLNPLFRAQIFLNGTRLFTDTSYDSISPDISGDGMKIVFVSKANPLGTNPEHNQEVFLYTRPGGVLRQLTTTTKGSSSYPIISRDGAWVYFSSDAPFFGSVDDGTQPYRVSTDAGLVERLGGYRRNGATWGAVAFVSLNRSNSQFTFGGSRGWDDQDSGASDLFLVDFDAPAVIQVSPSAPTLLTWAPEPGAKRYDVIRGDVADLSLNGGTIDLGEVTCLEDDSPDSHTRAHEDLVQPGPGQAFYYLYRPSQGAGDTLASWGRGAGGRERVAGAGGCPAP